MSHTINKKKLKAHINFLNENHGDSKNEVELHTLMTINDCLEDEPNDSTE